MHTRIHIFRLCISVRLYISMNESVFCPGGFGREIRATVSNIIAPNSHEVQTVNTLSIRNATARNQMKLRFQTTRQSIERGRDGVWSDASVVQPNIPHQHLPLPNTLHLDLAFQCRFVLKCRNVGRVSRHRRMPNITYDRVRRRHVNDLAPQWESIPIQF